MDSFSGVRCNRIAENKIIECGVMAIALLLAMAFLPKFVDLPGWAFGSLLLIFLLCVATLIFVAQRAYHALRHRRAK